MGQTTTVRERVASSIHKQLSATHRTTHHGVLYVLFSLVVLNYVATPLGTDIQINVAFAQQAQLLGSFPGNVVQAWTIRGIGYKLVVYVPFVIADSLVGYYNKPLFELVYRIEITALYLAVIGVSGLVCRTRLRRDGYDVISILFAVTVFFLTASHWIGFQPDEIAALFTLLGVALSISERRGTTYLAGIVFALLATLKGITIVFVVIGYLLVLGYEGEYRDYYPTLVATTVVAGVVVGGALYAFAPRTIFDVLEGAQFQSTLQYSIVERIVLVSKLTPFIHLPVLGPGGVVGVALLAAELRSRRYYRLALLAGLGLVPAAYVLVQAKGFGYHFAAFVPTAVGLYVWLEDSSRSFGDHDYSSIFLVVVLLVAVLFTSYAALGYDSAADEWAKDAQSQAHHYAEIRSQTGITEDDTVLYLADGTATYYLGAKSYLRYYYPLPIQRAEENEQLRQSQVFERTYERALAFDGRYVIVTSWFDVSKFPRLQQKLDCQYEVVYRGSIQAWYEDRVTVYERQPQTCSEGRLSPAPSGSGE